MFFANNAVAGVYQSKIVLDRDVNKSFEVTTESGNIEILAIAIDGKARPPVKINEGIYVISNIGQLNIGSEVIVYYWEDNNSNTSNAQIGIKYGNEIIDNAAPGVLLDIEGPLANVTDTLSFGIAGVEDTNRVGFNIGAQSIQEKGEVWITFHDDFNPLDIDSSTITYSDNDPANNANEPAIDQANSDVIVRTVVIKLDDGTPAAPNSRISLKFAPVTNPTTAGDYTVTVMTLDSTGNIIYISTTSQFFTVSPDALDDIVIDHGDSISIPSDSVVVFNATGYDQHNNAISGLSFTWDVTVDSCGTINDGSFRAIKLGECYVRAVSGGITDSSGLISVISGAFNRFGLTGYPISRMAGQDFPAPITVSIYDINDNIIYGYKDSVYFFSSDNSAEFTYDDGNLYHFQSADSGQKSFAGTNFELRTTGSQTIGITNGSESDTTTSAPINVTPASINAFSFSSLDDQTAGIPFFLNVTNARDEFGNFAIGTISITVVEGGGNSPGGVQPVINDITINNDVGIGSARQTLTNADSTGFKGNIGLVNVFTDTINVIPGAAEIMTLSNYPIIITAGVTFPSPANDPIVAVADVYGNVCTNYTGTVAFSEADSVHVPYQFQVSDAGIHTFPGSAFMFDSTGSRRLIVIDQGDNTLTDTSSVIQVNASEINSFTLSAPASVTAGSSFNLTVSNAVDQYGNPANGTVVVTVHSGGGSSPGGMPYTINDIPVADGSGFASQILTNTVPTVLRGTANGHTDDTDVITVNPGIARNISLTNYPDTITAGQTFPSPANNPRVTVTDNYGNISTNYIGTVTFSGADSVHNDYTFVLGDGGVKDFPGTAFIFEQAGSQRLIVADNPNSLADTSSIIEVYASPIIDSFTLSAPASVTAGAVFTLAVSNAVDQYNNPTNGTVAVTIQSGGGSSPGGVPPTINDIAVTNGSGSTDQVLTNAVPTVLRGSANGHTDDTDAITVNPGTAGNISLTNYPDSIIAGETFPSPANDPRVTVTDDYGNVKTDYTGMVAFSSADSVHDDYTFILADAGIKDFPGTAFRFEQAGSRRLIVADNVNGLADTSSIIEVYAVSAISSFTLSAPASVTAGAVFTLTVSNAVDQYNNPTNGTVAVTIQSGGGSSPGGVPPTINDIAVTNGSGSAGQILTNTVSTVLRGTANGHIDDTDAITVNPGAAGNISLTNYPDTITAGETFPSPANDPRVTVTDDYGNVKTDYTGTAAFSGADSVHDDYTFILADVGIKDFPGTAFRFEQAGSRRLIVADNVNGLADTSSVIQVFAAEIASFTLSASDTVTAGEAFNLTVSGAVDQFGNNTAGVVVISDSLGAGNSPDNTPPIFNNIPVNNGTGSAEQVLTRAGIARLKGVSGSVIRATDSMTVLPGVLREMVMVVASPLVSGNPFADVSTLTAKDDYGNMKTNFDASADSIVIGSSTSGPMTNNVLDQAADFIDGIADLHDLNVAYNGIGGQVIFNAASQSGIYGESNTVDVISLLAEDISLEINQVLREDTARGSVRCSNLGSVAMDVINIAIFDENSSLLISPVFDPSLPVTLPGGANTTFDFSFEVPAGSSPGSYPLSVAFTGQYTGFNTYDTLDVFGDTLMIVTLSNLVYLDNTLSPDTVSTGLEYGFTIDVHNDGGLPLSLDDSTAVFFTDGTNDYRASLVQSSVIGPGADGRLTFEQAEVSSSFTGGLYPIMIYIYGSDSGGPVMDSLTLTDSLLVQTAVSITYNTGSLTPDTVLVGAEAAFSVRVNNSSQTVLLVDHDLTKISFTDGDNSFVALIDTASAVRIDQILFGDTTLSFTSTSLPSEFVEGDYQPVVHIAGIQNQQGYSAALNTDTVHVFSPGQIRMDSLYTIGINSDLISTRVNVNQPFTVHGYINNLGFESVDSITLMLASDGNSSYAETLFIGTVDGSTGAAFDYNITAASAPNLSEVFYCSILKAINSISGENAHISTPLDNSAIVIIEDSALFRIDTLYLSDDSLSTNQEFMVYAKVGHSGSNSYDGSDQLIIDFTDGSGYQVDDSLTRDFIPNQLLSWRVTAPDQTRPSDTMTVSFNGSFIDLNDSTTALQADSIAITIIVVTDRAAITHAASITAPPGATDGILSTGQFFTITDSLFPSGNTGESYARISLPSGFSSADPMVQALSGQAIEWQINVCDETVIDSLRLDCWSIDSNTGDSVFDQTIWIPIEVVERAALSLGLEITEPPSAIDRTIMPEAIFTLQAVVTKTGDAETSQGELTLIFEDIGFSVDESIVASFSPGVPVEWHVTAPDTQIVRGIPFSVVISSLPLDLNTNEPAAVTIDSIGFNILLKDELPELIMSDPEPMGGAIASGQPIDIYRFTLRNSSDIPDHCVALTSFGYRLISDDNIVAPVDILSSSSLCINDDSDNTYAGVLSDSIVTFEFDPDMLIGPDSSIIVAISITPVDNPAVDVFRVHFESDDIVVWAVIDGVYEQLIDAVLPDGQEFSLEGAFLTVLEAEFMSSVTVNNNPYLASVGNLEIGYNLSEDSDIDITIFSVNGRKVWEFNANTSNGKGSAGQHFNDNAVIWDGRNQSGHRVLSGVYYIFITNNTSGQTAKIKVAAIW